MPLVSLTFPHRWRKAGEELIRKERIDTVVSVIAPDEALYTGYLIKRRNPSVEWIAYYIDAGTNILTGTSFEPVKRILQRKAVFWENKVLAFAKKIIVMEGHASYYRQNLMEKNKRKLRVANVPLLIIPTEKRSVNTQENDSIERWVYTGNMSSRLYDPRPLCELFAAYRKTHPAKLHLYGPSDHREYLETIVNKDSGIIWHGMVSHEEIFAIQSSADLLVYYVCKDVDSVSGKLFEYLGTGKRILYLGPEDDINARQLAKYDRGLALPMDEPLPTLLQRLEAFLGHTQNASAVDPADLCACYEQNMPSFTARIITD